MYSFFLSFHNILRWAVLVMLVVTVVRMFAGWLGKKEWSRRDEMLAAMLPGLLDLQLLVGGILYFFVSPLTRQALSNFSAAMADSALRFFAIDHASTMLVGVILAHVFRVLSKKSPLAAGKFRWAAIGFGLALLLILLAIPWPFSSVARPWLRLGSFLLN
jgi:hypothetical protein